LTVVIELGQSAGMTLAFFIGMAVAGGLGMYFGIGGLLEYVYYRRRRADAEAWKCQPHRWPSARARRNEILLGVVNMTLGSIATGLLAYLVYAHGWTRIYFDEYGLAFSVATAVGYFVLTDGALYWAHRLLHRRALFRTIHRVHHRWTSPTAFTSAAMHPLEFALYQAVTLAPLFFLPVHVAGAIAVLIYHNTVALIDHSGINLRSWIPWQPPARFHDDHHVYFHVNFGQTLGLWDRMFGTWRRQGRAYGEHIYGGKGAPLRPGDDGPPEYIDYRHTPATASAAKNLDTVR
jgi:Delta7-sterol 5-desaturase